LLAATGMTNVAAALSIAPKTFEANLFRGYHGKPTAAKAINQGVIFAC
jgi:hypothetical protein